MYLYSLFRSFMYYCQSLAPDMLAIKI